jgi:hypothetical protein
MPRNGHTFSIHLNVLNGADDIAADVDALLLAVKSDRAATADAPIAVEIAPFAPLLTQIVQAAAGASPTKRVRGYLRVDVELEPTKS